MMNAQQLEYVRIKLRAALQDESGSMKGQLEAFSEHPPADKNGYPRQHIHRVALDGDRWVNAENSAMYVLETRSRRRPRPPIGEVEFSLCSWRRALLKLDEHQIAWVKYCYGFDLKFDYQMSFCQHVWGEYQKYLADNPVQRKVEKRLVSLVWLAAQDVAAKNKNDLYREYAGSVLASLLSISRSTWSEVYAAHWSRLKKAFEELDSGALQAVLNRNEDNILEGDFA